MTRILTPWILITLGRTDVLVSGLTNLSVPNPFTQPVLHLSGHRPWMFPQDLFLGVWCFLLLAVVRFHFLMGWFSCDDLSCGPDPSISAHLLMFTCVCQTAVLLLPRAPCLLCAHSPACLAQCWVAGAEGTPLSSDLHRTHLACQLSSAWPVELYECFYRSWGLLAC